MLDGLEGTDRLRILHADRNRGKGHAIRLGLAQPRGDVIAIQDADLELDPAQLAALVAPILDGEADVVYGSRFLAGAPRRAARSRCSATASLTRLTNVLFGSSITDMETCYKIMRTSVARSLALTADRFDIEPEITARLLTAGHRIVERPVTFTAAIASSRQEDRLARRCLGCASAVAAPIPGAGEHDPASRRLPAPRASCRFGRVPLRRACGRCERRIFDPHRGHPRPVATHLCPPSQPPRC